jgi:general secretion pathway protein N
MNAANQRQLTPVLAAIAVLLGALWLLLLAGIGHNGHWAAARSLPPLPPAGNPADMPRAEPLEQFALVWQKPLFSPDRKPVAHAVDGGSSLGDLELTGIILTPRLRMALLHDKNGDRQLRLREGESLPDGSITLVEIRPRSALFDAPSGRTELKLPAGAPIDDPKAGAGAGAGTDAAAGNPSPGDAMMRVEAGGDGVRKAEDRSGNGHVIVPPRAATEDHSPASFIERARENAQKRRAARAAAGH